MLELLGSACLCHCSNRVVTRHSFSAAKVLPVFFTSLVSKWEKYFGNNIVLTAEYEGLVTTAILQFSLSRYCWFLNYEDAHT